MSHARVGAVVVLGLAVLSCQTITEDLPVTTITPSSVPVPLVVIQLPQPTVPPPPPSSPTAVPGSSSPSSPSSPSGQQQPQPTGAPSTSGGGNCEGFPPNCNPVVSIHAYVYFIMCNGVALPDTKFAESGPVDCDVRLDATPKDFQVKHTQAKGDPEWSIGGGFSSYVGNNPYTPTVRGGRNGCFDASVRIDGVWSNTFTYCFR